MNGERAPRKKTGVDRLEVYRKKAGQFFENHATVESCLAAFRDRDLGPRTRILGLLAAAIVAAGARETVLAKLRRTYDFSKIPINPDMYELEETRVQNGYWSEVYKLHPKRDDLETLVFKIEFPAKRHPADRLVAIAREYREEHRFFKEAYKDDALPRLVPESNYLVSVSPRTGKPAIAVIQTYAGDGAVDLLDTTRVEQIRGLLRSDPGFKRQFDAFRRITISLEQAGNAPDLAGKNNVLVVRIGDSYELRLVDHHTFDKDNQLAQAWQKKALQRLSSI